MTHGPPADRHASAEETAPTTPAATNAAAYVPGGEEESAELRQNRRRAIFASGIGWGLDGFTWTMYGFALAAAMPVLGMSTADTGFVTAVSIVASAVGGIIFGNLADRFGRVNMLSVVILGYSLFTALTATSQNGVQFLLWRTLEGIFFGGEWAVGAALVAEYARPERRGRVLSFVQSCYAIGWAVSTLAYLTLYSIFPEEVAWRYLFLVGILPALFAFIIRRTTKDATHLAASGAGKEVKKKQPTKLREIFTPQLRFRTMAATTLGIGVQGIYYSVFIFLPTYLRDERGLSIVGTASYTWVAVIGSFLGYFFSGFFHDAWGRRPAFLFFFSGSAASVALFVFTPAARPELGIPIILLLGFFASGQAGGTGAYLSELFPTEVRGTGQGFSYNVGRGLAAFGPLVVGTLAASIGWGMAITIICLAGAITGTIALAMLPETKNTELVTLADMEEKK